MKRFTRRDFLRVSLGLSFGTSFIGTAEGYGAESSYSLGPRRDSESIRVAALQSRHVPTCDGLKTDPFQKNFSMDDFIKSIERRVAWYEDLIEQAALENCQLVVLTEDFTRLSMSMRYLDNTDIFTGAVDYQTPLVREQFGATARSHNLYIVACYFARESGVIFNVADLFGPKGELVGRYRKVHMPQYELWQVAPGDAFPAFETEIGWIGMLICYDQMWPEAASCCTMNGAQIICHPSAAVLKDYLVRTRSMDNQVHYISATNRNSLICSPGADILADGQRTDPRVVWAHIDPANATKADQYHWEVLYSGIQDHKERHLKFRRPETYKVLTEKNPPLTNQYPSGGVADTQEAVQEVYRTQKAMYKRARQGKSIPYHWRW